MAQHNNTTMEKAHRFVKYTLPPDGEPVRSHATAAPLPQRDDGPWSKEFADLPRGELEKPAYFSRSSARTHLATIERLKQELADTRRKTAQAAPGAKRTRGKLRSRRTTAN